MAEGPLFIVDNSEGGRNGLKYLRRGKRRSVLKAITQSTSPVRISSSNSPNFGRLRPRFR